MGGVEATPDGLTNIDGLFAVGETACTGVHGANRLASNSLLEGLVFGKFLADYILTHHRKVGNIIDDIPETTVDKLPTKQEIQRKMMEYVGIVRHSNEIHNIIDWFKQYMPNGEDFVKLNPEKTTEEQYEIYNMLTTGYLVAKSAMDRHESIGAHYIVKDEK